MVTYCCAVGCQNDDDDSGQGDSTNTVRSMHLINFTFGLLEETKTTAVTANHTLAILKAMQ